MAGSDGFYKGVVATSASITAVNSARINRNLVEANRLQKLQNQHLKYMAEAQKKMNQVALANQWKNTYLLNENGQAYLKWDDQMTQIEEYFNSNQSRLDKAFNFDLQKAKKKTGDFTYFSNIKGAYKRTKTDIFVVKFLPKIALGFFAFSVLFSILVSLNDYLKKFVKGVFSFINDQNFVFFGLFYYLGIPIILLLCASIYILIDPHKSIIGHKKALEKGRNLISSKIGVSSKNLNIQQMAGLSWCLIDYAGYKKITLARFRQLVKNFRIWAYTHYPAKNELPNIDNIKFYVSPIDLFGKDTCQRETLEVLVNEVKKSFEL